MINKILAKMRRFRRGFGLICFCGSKKSFFGLKNQDQLGKVIEDEREKRQRAALKFFKSVSFSEQDVADIRCMSEFEDRNYVYPAFNTKGRAVTIEGCFRGKSLFIREAYVDYPEYICNGIKHVIDFEIDEKEIPVIHESKRNAGVKLYFAILKTRKLLKFVEDVEKDILSLFGKYMIFRKNLIITRRRKLFVERL